MTACFGTGASDRDDTQPQSLGDIGEHALDFVAPTWDQTVPIVSNIAKGQMVQVPGTPPEQDSYLARAMTAYDSQDFPAALYFSSRSLTQQFDYTAWKYFLLSNCKIGNFAALEPIVDMLNEAADLDLAIVKFDTFLFFRRLDEMGDLVRAHFRRCGFDDTARYFHRALGSLSASDCPVFHAWLQDLPPPSYATPFWRLVAPAPAPVQPAATDSVTERSIYIDVTGTIDHICANLPMTGIQRVCVSLLHALRHVNDVGKDIRLVYAPRYTVDPVCLSIDEFCGALVSTDDDTSTSRKLQKLAAFTIGVQELGVDYGWTTLTDFSPSEGDVIFFPDVFWGPHYTRTKSALTTKGLRTAFLVHDLIVLKDSEENANRSQNLAFANAASAVIRGADRIFVQSNATRVDVLTLAADQNREIRVSTIPFGEENFDVQFQTKPTGIPNSLTERRYVLSVGTLSRRKGFVQLARAFHRTLGALPSDVSLVFCGRWSKDLPEYKEIAALIAQAADRIILIDSPSDAQLIGLYRSASLFALISKDEGWGMPVSEALTQGTPLLLSNAGSLPEVAGEAALYVDPDDEAQISRAITEFFGDTTIGERLRQAQNALARRSWGDAARKLIRELYEI